MAKGVTATVYEDGTRVIVNATDSEFNYNGRNVSANNYIVLRQAN